MLFRYIRTDAAFVRALRAAVASHRPAALRALLANYGDQAFAKALSDLSGRVIADALSMLPAPDRAGVLIRLSRSARSRLREVTDGSVFDVSYMRLAEQAPRFLSFW